MKIISWGEKIIYQIFPRSFMDSNNDGDGDIKGIISKIGYLSELGVDAIWLCPTYDTDFEDAGYDVKNYKSVWSNFGTMSDFKELTKKANKFGIDIIIDIVLNHVSDKHEWFKKAVESVENTEHNYFIWRKKLTSHEKEAQSIFGGSAWEYVQDLNKYYFHLFSKSQVDLNWEHPDTIKAMVDIIDFWYDLGVRGFRLDAIKHISKKFPDGNKNNFSWGPSTVSRLKKFNSLAFKEKPDAFVLGEASSITVDEAIKYGVGKKAIATNFFNFAWWHIGWGKTGRNGYDGNWTYKEFANNMSPFQANKKIPPELMTNFLSNHDTSRAISRWGDENIFWKESAKTLALLQFSLKGIPCIYYGEEIGMLNPGFIKRNAFRDVDAMNAFNIFVDENKIYTEEEMVKYLAINGRDNSRTPMQWNGGVNSGFNNGEIPWIKIGDKYKEINVNSQINDKNSILNFYKTIIQLRKSKYKNILVNGTSNMKILRNGLIKIERRFERKKIIVLINLTKNYIYDVKLRYDKQIITTWSDNRKFRGNVRPYESLLFKGEK